MKTESEIRQFCNDLEYVEAHADGLTPTLEGTVSALEWVLDLEPGLDAAVLDARQRVENLKRQSDNNLNN